MLYAKLRNVLFAVVTGLITLNSLAEELSEQRYHYELAKASLKRDQTALFEKHYQLLGNYPLRVYLDYSIAVKEMRNGRYEATESFIQANHPSFLTDKLHRQFLLFLALRREYKDLLFWYKDGLADETTTCRWLEARHQSGDNSAYYEVKPLWTQARSLPKACDSLFTPWLKSSAFNEDFAWERFVLSMKAGKLSLARYSASLLPKPYQAYVTQIRALHDRPHLISRRSNYREQSPYMEQVIAYGIQRYAKFHPQKALNIWESYEASRLFSDATIVDTKLTIARQLVRKKHFDSAQLLVANSPSLKQSAILERLIRESLKQENWKEVMRRVELLEEQSQKSDRWRYWYARAQLQSRNPDWEAEGLVTYRDLAKERSFYGFLAADALSQPYSLQNQSLIIDAQVLETLEKQPALARAKELWLTGKTAEAYAEWYYGLRQLSSKELAGAGVLAAKWGWHDRAIQAMIAGKHWNHLDIRFPLAYQEHVLDAAKMTALPPELIFAVARQESAMSEAAKSSAGARGLMQLMPATAKQTAKKHGIRHRTEDLYSPDHNISLGSRYLDELLDQFNGNRILATAAYNAGPHRVNRWINDTNAMLPFDVWIETIPFKETRGYVQNVLTFSVIYSHRMGKPQTLITEIEATRKL